MQVAILLAFCAFAPWLSGVEGAQPKCQSLCSVCETLHKTKVHEICFKQKLEACKCPQYAIYNESVTDIRLTNCPKPDGFCPFGHEVSSISGCPTSRCLPAAGCPTQSDWASRCGPGAFCPAGYRTDSSGCPTCGCVCEDPKRHAVACGVACSAAGADFVELAAAGDKDADCPVCVCRAKQKALTDTSSSSSSSSSSSPLPTKCVHRCKNNCGKYGFVNNTRDEHGCIADCSCRCPVGKDWRRCPSTCPVTWSADEFGCQVCRCAGSHESRWCPAPPACGGHDCGPYGFRVSPATGCRVDCACNCPPTSPATACPTGCDGRVEWSTDKYGCAVCKCNRKRRCPRVTCGDCGRHGYATDSNGCKTCHCNCPSLDSQCQETGCQSWTIDAYGCVVCEKCKPAAPCIKKADAAVAQLCKGKCKSFILTEDEDTGCLSCSCQARCPPEPRCLIGCGPYPRKRDANDCVTSCDCDCPKVTLAECAATCSFNATLAKDAYGCLQCKCESPRCPYTFRCSKDCGVYGYEADARGCQTSCNCNCPKRNCGCFFGSKKDKFGCDTCECISI